MTTRRDICIAECPLSESDGLDHVACERMCDDRRWPVPCLLKAALADRSARCPSDDHELARRWNEAPVYVAPGCGAASKVRSAVTSLLQIRVPICLACPHHFEGWGCRKEGRTIRRELRDPNYACKDGRFGPAELSQEGLPS